MKKLILLSCVLTAILVTLTACGPKDNKIELDLEVIAAALTSSGYFPDTLEALDPGFVEGSLSLYEDRIEAKPEDIADARHSMAFGVVADQFFVLKAVDDAAADRLEAALKTYAEDQKSAFEFYAPEQAARLDDPIIKRQGVYILFVIGEDQESLSELCDRLMAGENIQSDITPHNTQQVNKLEEIPTESLPPANAAIVDQPSESDDTPILDPAAEEAARAYYAGTVFEVVSMELKSNSGPRSIPWTQKVELFYAA